MWASLKDLYLDLYSRPLVTVLNKWNIIRSCAHAELYPYHTPWYHLRHQPNFFFKRLYWDGESKGEPHYYSWQREGSHFSATVQSRASAQSFTKGQRRLTPNFPLINNLKGRLLRKPKYHDGNLPDSTEGCRALNHIIILERKKKNHKNEIKKDFYALTYRKLGSPRHISKGACMPQVWVQSMSRWSFCPAHKCKNVQDNIKTLRKYRV